MHSKAFQRTVSVFLIGMFIAALAGGEIADVVQKRRIAAAAERVAILSAQTYCGVPQFREAAIERLRDPSKVAPC